MGINLTGLALHRRAILLVQQLKRELDLTEGDLAVAVEEAQTARAQVAEYENAITWDVTCLHCSALLDRSVKEFERAERAEAAMAGVKALLEFAAKVSPNMLIRAVWVEQAIETGEMPDLGLKIVGQVDDGL